MQFPDEPWSIPEDFRIDPEWFDHPSRIHGTGHTLRVMILSLILLERWESGPERPRKGPPRDQVLAAALIHDMGRRHDGVCLHHGAWARAGKRRIAEAFFGRTFSVGEWESVGAAVEAHSRPDPTPSFPEGSLAALLKDADALDRFRLGSPPDPDYFRHTFTEEYLGYAEGLLALPEHGLLEELRTRAPSGPQAG